MNEVDIRPWGKYEILLDQDNTKVKKITINPGQRLSYQIHEKRDEHWTVIDGELTIILDDIEIVAPYGKSVLIPRKSKHRACNLTDKIVEFIEVQTGLYFGEEEQTRLMDDYGRS